MFKKTTLCAVALCLMSISVSVYAENLVQVYLAARLSSPSLREAAADNEAARQAIEGARSALLPQISLSGSSGWTQGTRENVGIHSRSTDGSLSLNQTLFNMSSWHALTLQQKQAALQKINYQSLQQALLLDVATAYFNMLKAADTLTYTEAEKQSVGHQLEQTTRKFQVGSLAITDMQNVQAQYDQVLSAEVRARNDVDNSYEALREVSGLTWTHLAVLDTAHFKARKLTDVNTLLEQAESNSLQLWSARLSRETAKIQIDAAQAGHFPEVALSASMGLSGSKSKQDEIFGKNISGNRQLGISVSVPIYGGGGISAAVRQSESAWISASEHEESVHRNMVKSIRSAFNDVNSAVGSIAADEQTVISAQSSLDATQNGYLAGTRTMLDVLNATTTLYNARRSLSADRYDYLLAGLTLKNTQGLLGLEDLQACNVFLGKEKDMRLPD